MKLSSLSILIPAYKDDKTIKTVLARSRQVGRLYAKKFEIVVCNDGSPDAVGIILERAKKQIPELRILTHKKNKGFGVTIKELYYAGKYAWLYTTPGDYQIDPMEIKKLLPYTTKAAYIIGWRMRRYEVWNRKLQSYCYNGLLRLLFGIWLHDVNSVRLFERRVLPVLCTGSSAFIDAKLTIDVLHRGFRVQEVPIKHRERKTMGASGGRLSVILPVIQEMLSYWIYRRV